MLIKQIMNSDIANCYEAFKNDAELNMTEDKFYRQLSKLPDAVKFEFEQTVNSYLERVTRIAYLQGIVDFTNLFVILKEKPNDILQKYVDV